LFVGSLECSFVGEFVAAIIGFSVGTELGDPAGSVVSSLLGDGLGKEVGLLLGSFVGKLVGDGLAWLG